MSKFINSMIGGRINGREVEGVMYNREILWDIIFEKYAVSYTVTEIVDYRLSDVALPTFKLYDGTSLKPGLDSRYPLTIYLKNGNIVDDPNTYLTDIAKVEIYYNEDVKSISFSGCSEITDLLFGKTDNLTSMAHMFDGCSKLTSLELSHFNTSNVTDMSYMFNNCSGLTSLDLSSFDTSNVENMSNMIYNCSSLSVLNLCNWDTSKVVNADYMLYNVPESVNWKYDYYKYANFNLTEEQTGYGYDFPWSHFNIIYSLYPVQDEYFNNNFKLTLSYKSKPIYKIMLKDGIFTDDTGDISISDIAYVMVNCESDLENLSYTNYVKEVFKCSVKVSDADYMFAFSSYLEKVNLSELVTSNCETMECMFAYCPSLTSLDVSNFDTSNVTTMRSMFNSCSSLTSLDLSNFNTSNVTDMGRMFSNCSSLTSLDLSNFNTSNVTDMGSMFYYCSSLTSLNVSNFNTSKVTNMNNMFADCRSLTSLDVSKFDTSNVTDTSHMFYYCKLLTSLDVSSFNTSKVTNMHSMFADCRSLTSLDLSSFITFRVDDCEYMLLNVQCPVYISNYFNLTEEETKFEGQFIRL